ncbi:MAG: phosphoglucomutase (alpha-D-glucose-1,6-bisphosphate-dependent), partial [Myxococcota bacterium]
AFGTSGHRGSSLRSSFNEAHIAAIVQAVCDHRKKQGVDGPLFLGADTHALSEPAWATALEVLAANEVVVLHESDGAPVPTPAVSHAIVTYNRGRESGYADGLIITPSHNPPEDGGIKYNPPHGGPAAGDETRSIETRANALLRQRADIARMPLGRAVQQPSSRGFDFRTPYVEALSEVIHMARIAAAGVRIGADPLGGAGVHYWPAIAERYQLDLTVVDDVVDPTFSVMPLDKDGRIRMDCSSPYAMTRLVGLKDDYDVAVGNDTDFDRHGIVTPDGGLMNPNHYLSVAIDYLFQTRGGWKEGTRVGKTLVSSALIDRVAKRHSLPLLEVPVGFKWFVDGLSAGTLGFGGEESAGASFLRLDGRPWTTDKDGFILALLAAEISAARHMSPSACYRGLVEELGEPHYARIDAPATDAQKKSLKSLSPEQLSVPELAGASVTAVMTHAPGNDAPIGGVKVATEEGWFAARPSGTEALYKVYAESFRGPEHLAQIQEEAQALVSGWFADG